MAELRMHVEPSFSLSDGCATLIILSGRLNGGSTFTAGTQARTAGASKAGSDDNEIMRWI